MLKIGALVVAYFACVLTLLCEFSCYGRFTCELESLYFDLTLVTCWTATLYVIPCECLRALDVSFFEMAMRKPSIYGLAPYTFPYVWELSSSVDCAVALACFSVKMVCFFALSAAFVFVVFVAVSLSVEDYRVFFSDVVSGVRRLCRTSRFCLRPLGIFTRVVFQSYCFMSLTLDSRYDVETQGSVHGTTRAWLFHLIQMTWLTTVLPCLTAEMMMPEPRHEPPPPLAQAINWAAVVANRRADEGYFSD